MPLRLVIMVKSMVDHSTKGGVGPQPRRTRLQQSTNAESARPMPDVSLPSEISAICAEYRNSPDALLEILLDVQTANGWIEESAIRSIALALNLTRADVHGVVSFYPDFKTEPAPRTLIKMCRGEACQARGGRATEAALKAGLGLDYDQHSADGAIGLEAVYCLGNCTLGPAAEVAGKLVSRLTPDRVGDVLNRVGAGS